MKLNYFVNTALIYERDLSVVLSEFSQFLSRHLVLEAKMGRGACKQKKEEEKRSKRDEINWFRKHGTLAKALS